MPPEGFADFVTPIDQFFVRTHVRVPKVDIAQWRLKIDGHVNTPLELSMGDLQKMRSAEIIGVLECAGNGRAFFDPPIAGLQWQNGGVGNGRWKGVRVVDVLQRVGVKPAAVEVLFDGADVPIGTMEDFRRSIPMKKALHPDTILAYSMNGQPLPEKHGFPLRVVAPGWAGDSWVKWVTGIRVLSEEWQGFWMKSAYRYPTRPVAPGTLPPADQMVPVTNLRVKSVITSPANESKVRLGVPTVVRGFAWTGDTGGRIAGVDVSVDQGNTWKSARLTGPATLHGWRQWEFSWTPKIDGLYSFRSRAFDTSGAVQPLVAEWNPSGYLWNVAARVNVAAGNAQVAIVDRPSTPPITEATPGIFRERCLVCHDDDVVRQQRLTREQWDREINKMAGWGARVQSDEREALLDYLLKISGPKR
jgi:DMSO/TMAO reductase YedYZ molybdopterin-dependent catalytic subunit